MLSMIVAIAITCIEEMAGGTRKFVDEKLKQRPVLLFSKTRDPDCLTVKRVLAEYAMPPNIYEACEIEQRQDCAQIETYFLVLCMGSQRKVKKTPVLMVVLVLFMSCADRANASA